MPRTRPAVALSYLLWHRSPWVPAAKLPLYAAGAVLATEAGTQVVLAAAASFIAVELGAGVARRQWNDVHDYGRDEARGNRWTPAFVPGEARLVLAVAAVRVVLAIALALAFRSIALVLVLVVMLTLQHLYQGRSSSRRWLALGLVASSYFLRALAPAAVLSPPWSERGAALLGACALAYAGAIQVFDWRRAETEFLVRNGLPLKPDSTAFSGERGRSGFLSVAILALAIAVLIAPAPAPPFGAALALLAIAGLIVSRGWRGAWWAPMPCLAMICVLGAGLHGLLGSVAAMAAYALGAIYRFRLTDRPGRAAYFTADR